MAMFSGVALFQPEFGMGATGPVNRQNDLSLLLIHIGDYLPNRDSYNSLLQSRVCRGRVPNGWQILRQAHEDLLVWYCRSRRLAIELVKPVLQVLNLLQRDVPSNLQLGRYQSLLGIYRVVSAGRQAHLVPRLFHFQFEGLSQLLSLAVHSLGCFQCGFNRVSFYGLQDFMCNIGVYSQAAKGNAAALPAIV
jgi:hypothetical protein